MSTTRVESGLLSGLRQETAAGPVLAFLGIPYADPGGRFRPAGPVPPWSGARAATERGPAAPQALPIAGHTEPGDEARALNLNVWTPAIDDRHRPVMVWVHGGAYVVGSNADPLTDGGDLAARQDVVVVAVNHRLGFLGFLDVEHLLGSEFADSGNVALHDLIAGLEWTQRNIARFGGDPAAVTLFGQSAGAAAIGTLLGTPRATGLFHRAIMQSGTAQRVRDRPLAREITAAFLVVAGIPERDAERLLSAGLADLLAAQDALVARATGRAVGPGVPFQPTIDHRLLHRLPIDELAAGTNATVDLVAGTTAHEAVAFADILGLADPAGTRATLDRVLARTFSSPGDAEAQYRRALAADLARPAGDGDVLTSLVTDHRYRTPSDRLLDVRADAAGRTYGYLFGWPSPLLSPPAAAHGVDVPFVFNTIGRPAAADVVGAAPPWFLGEQVSAAWAAFARTGRPEAAGLPSWPEYTRADRQTMVLDDPPRVVADPNGEVRRFWARNGTA